MKHLLVALGVSLQFIFTGTTKKA